MRLASLRSGLALIAVLATAGCDSGTPTTATCPDADLQAVDLTVGTGQAVNPNSVVRVRYVGSFPDGAVFDSTRTAPPGTSTLALGGTQTSGPPIPGFRFGIGGAAAIEFPAIQPMRLGGRRRITVPPNLGYGGRPYPPAPQETVIPACSTLIFDVLLVDAS